MEAVLLIHAHCYFLISSAPVVEHLWLQPEPLFIQTTVDATSEAEEENSSRGVHSKVLFLFFLATPFSFLSCSRGQYSCHKLWLAGCALQSVLSLSEGHRSLQTLAVCDNKLPPWPMHLSRASDTLGPGFLILLSKGFLILLSKIYIKNEKQT